MHRLLARTTLALVFALLLASLAGCGEASTTTDESSASAESTETSTPAELPPAPVDVSGLGAWFAEAYPEAAWLSRITDIQYEAGEVPHSGGFSNAVVISTDLDYETEQDVAEEIVAALGETGLTWAVQYVVWFGEGGYEMAGTIVDMTP